MGQGFRLGRYTLPRSLSLTLTLTLTLALPPTLAQTPTLTLTPTLTVTLTLTLPLPPPRRGKRLDPTGAALAQLLSDNHAAARRVAREGAVLLKNSPTPSPNPNPNPEPNPNPDPEPNPNQVRCCSRTTWRCCSVVKVLWRPASASGPRVLELAAFKAADSTAFEHAGAGRGQRAAAARQ